MIHYNLLVIGSGSGGLATARRAAYHAKQLGKTLKIGVIERDVSKMTGGTCVNVGCVPKKVMWSAATIADTVNHLSSHYGFSFQSKPNFDFSQLVKGREIYIERLRGIYRNNLKDAGIDLIPGFAKFADNPKTLVVEASSGEATEFTADHIVVACGSRPVIPNDIEGTEHCIDSDGFFALTKQPESAIVIGSGYIAVELSGVLNSLGTKTTMCVRGDKPLRNFDSMISDELAVQMKQNGVDLQTGFIPMRVSLNSKGLRVVESKDGRTVEAETVLLAVGRSSGEYLKRMNVPPEIVADHGEHIKVNKLQDTPVHGVYAIGDVIGKAELTPVAIAAGRRLADRLFGGTENAKISYENIPTVVFSHPLIGTVGLTEEAARKQYEKVRVYTSGFVNSLYGILPISGPPKPKSRMKVICHGDDERVVGMHVIGDGADEMMQGFGVAVRMNATKADLDNCIAIHPTAAEEFVTMAPWGLK
jgi:glutathione reductase (NADPH)